MQYIILWGIITLSYFCKFVIYRQIMSFDELLDWNMLLAGYMSCLAASIAFASIALIERKKYLSIFIMLIIDLWMIANSIYTDANNVWIDWQVIANAGQIRGFEDSIISYLKWIYIAFLAITVLSIYLTSMFVNVSRSRKRSWKIFGWTVLSASIIYLGTWVMRGQAFNNNLTPIRKEKLIIKTHSPAAHIIMVGTGSIKEEIMQRNAAIPLTDTEKQILSICFTETVTQNPPQGHLVYILVESLESWALKATDTTGEPVCPNLNRYVHEHEVLFSDNIHSQQLYGRSGDGQLITQTGILPISHGITCMRYGENIYPNLAHFYQDGVILNPFPKVWNQEVTTYSYGFKRLREPSNIFNRGSDSIILAQAREELEHVMSPVCVLAITINTHTPFYSAPTTMDLDEAYTKTENRYLQCARYFDTHAGRFLAWADTAKTMQNATIVITADHNHFPQKRGQGVCPLIIRSPNIKHFIYIPEAYQMDIFPTVLHAIGQSNYAWRGFGIDLLDSTAVRTISEEQAYSLSDRMIRTNFFAGQLK